MLAVEGGAGEGRVGAFVFEPLEQLACLFANVESLRGVLPHPLESERRAVLAEARDTADHPPRLTAPRRAGRAVLHLPIVLLQAPRGVDGVANVVHPLASRVVRCEEVHGVEAGVHSLRFRGDFGASTSYSRDFFPFPQKFVSILAPF